VTGTWDPIPGPPSPRKPPRSSSVSFRPASSRYLASLSQRSRAPADAVRRHSRISLASFSFPSSTVRAPIHPTISPPAARLCRSLSFSVAPEYRRRCLPRSCLSLSLSLSLSASPPPSKHYFSSATNAKLKRISPILSVNMRARLQRGGQSFSSVHSLRRPTSLPLSLSLSLSLSRAIVRTRTAAFGEWVRGPSRARQPGRWVVLLFRQEIASKLRRRCTCAHLATLTLRSRE